MSAIDPSRPKSGFDAGITFAPSRDLEANARFYRDLLGLPLVLDQGTCRIYRVRRGAYLGFCTHLAPPPGDGVILTLVADAVDDWHARLRAADVPIDGPPRVHPIYRIHHFFARDPDGHRVEIQRFLDPFDGGLEA